MLLANVASQLIGMQGVCAAGTPPVTVQIIDTSSSGMQLDSADMTTVSAQGNRLGHVGGSVEQVGLVCLGLIKGMLAAETAAAGRRHDASLCTATHGSQFA